MYWKNEIISSFCIITISASDLYLPMIRLYVFLLDFLIPFLCDPDLQCMPELTLSLSQGSMNSATGMVAKTIVALHHKSVQREDNFMISFICSLRFKGLMSNVLMVLMFWIWKIEYGAFLVMFVTFRSNMISLRTWPQNY